jgi:uncharacterized protein (TIGR03382 family)
MRWVSLLHSLLVGLGLTLSGAALAQTDAGPGAPAVCGALTDEGSCFGQTAAWCSQPNDLQENSDADTVVVDCAELDASCVLVPGFGAWCAVEAGERSLIADGARASALACMSSPGVVADGACSVGGGCLATGSCTPPGPAPFVPACVGDVLHVACSVWGQPVVVDCAAGASGTCGDGRCLDQPADSPCDGAQLLCASGLECVGPVADAGPAAIGSCVAPGTPAEVVPAPEPADPPPVASGCAAASPGGIAPLLLLFCAVGGLRRRRG